MSLATAEETEVNLQFPSAIAYGDFMQNAHFVVMYNGSLQTLTPTADQTGGKLRAPDTQVIAYWREWSVPSNHEVITLAPGRSDWRLIAIYTEGDYYQLKPEDLIGLRVPYRDNAAITSFGQILANGQEAAMVFGGMPMKFRLDGDILKYYGTHCGPADSQSTPMYGCDYQDGYVIINSYRCYEETPGGYITDIETWFADKIPSLQISAAQYMGDADDFSQPVLWGEV